MTEVARTQRVLTAIRAVAVPFAAAQIATYYLPHPPDVLLQARLAVGLLALGTVVVWAGSRRARTPRAARGWALAGLAVDTTAALGLCVAYTFDPDTAVWALLYLVVVEGAIVFQLRGAVGVVGVVTAGYVLREVYGAARYDIPLLWQSISFRMGIAVLMAVVVGLTASRLVAERDRLREMADQLERRHGDLEDANDALRRARRAQLDFVAVTNHELRTPLTAISGFARTLRLRWDEMDEPSRRAAVDAIDTQSRRLGEMVEDVLTVSSMRAGGLALAPRPLGVRAWLVEAAEVCEVDARIDCPSDLLVLADPTRLLQIVTNLLTNAVKYGQPPVDVTAREADGRVLIVVRDHGPGVPPDFQPQMFEEFTQASVGETRTAEGYGLGLAIVRYLVGALGGTVTYRQAEGGGAAFQVELPGAGGIADAARGRDTGDQATARP